MKTINVSKIAAASFMAGLQNVGQVSVTAYVTGTLYGSPNSVSNTSNMNGVFTINMPNPNVISVLRVNLPNAAGQLASRWFPLFGTCQLTDSTNNWRLLLYVGTSTAGRVITFNFVNLKSTLTNFTGSGGSYPFAINVYGHLYSFPW
jgi:hypothetical protein